MSPGLWASVLPSGPSLLSGIMGKLGSFHTNNRSVTISMMKKFLHGVKTISQYQQIECEDLPNLAEFNLIDEKQEATNAARECIRRKDILSDNDLLQVLYSIISVPKWILLTQQTVRM